MGKKECLCLATRAVNNTAGSDGLTHTVLFFGTTTQIPFPNVENTRVNLKSRFKALETARKEMATVTCWRRTAAALKHRIENKIKRNLNPETNFGFTECNQNDMRARKPSTISIMIEV